MAKISNVEVFGLASSIYRSGYPMMSRPPDEDEFAESVQSIEKAISEHRLLGRQIENPHIRRAIRLAQAKGGGHDQFLTGIVVNFDMTFSNKAWVEAERYTFLNFISSMSTMHRASVLPIEESCNQYVLQDTIARLQQLQDDYNAIDGTRYPQEKAETYLRLLYNLPSGFELTAGMTTNYRSLKNQYQQRHDHRIPDWRLVYCPWIETLPLSGYLITGKETL